MGPPDSGRVSRVRPYSGAHSEVLSLFAYGAVTLYGVLSSVLRLCAAFLTSADLQAIGHESHDPPYTTLLGLHARGLGCVQFARRYYGHRCFFLFLGLLRCFNSPRCPPTAMHSPPADAELTRAAFPHSEIPGSKVVCTSPRLIAADHVLRRLSAPRHPPRTLSSLTTEALVGIPRSTSRAAPQGRGVAWSSRGGPVDYPTGARLLTRFHLYGTLFTCQRPSQRELRCSHGPGPARGPGPGKKDETTSDASGKRPYDDRGFPPIEALRSLERR